MAVHQPVWEAWTNWGEPMEPNRRRFVELAERAVALDPNDAGNRWVFGHVLGYERRWPESDAKFAAACKLDPNNADAWAMQSDLIVMSGRPADAVEHVQKALRLNPHPPHWYYWMLGLAQYASANTTEPQRHCVRRRRIALARGAFWRQPWRSSGGSTRRAGRRNCLRYNPHFTISQWVATRPFRDEAVREHFVEATARLGCPIDGRLPRYLAFDASRLMAQRRLSSLSEMRPL